MKTPFEEVLDELIFIAGRWNETKESSIAREFEVKVDEIALKFEIPHEVVIARLVKSLESNRKDVSA